MPRRNHPPLPLDKWNTFWREHVEFSLYRKWKIILGPTTAAQRINFIILKFCVFVPLLCLFSAERANLSLHYAAFYDPQKTQRPRKYPRYCIRIILTNIKNVFHYWHLKRESWRNFLQLFWLVLGVKKGDKINEINLPSFGFYSLVKRCVWWITNWHLRWVSSLHFGLNWWLIDPAETSQDTLRLGGRESCSMTFISYL